MLSYCIVFHYLFVYIYIYIFKGEMRNRQTESFMKILRLADLTLDGIIVICDHARIVTPRTFNE